MHSVQFESNVINGGQVETSISSERIYVSVRSAGARIEITRAESVAEALDQLDVWVSLFQEAKNTIKREAAFYLK